MRVWAKMCMHAHAPVLFTCLVSLVMDPVRMDMSNHAHRVNFAFLEFVGTYHSAIFISRYGDWALP